MNNYSRMSLIWSVILAFTLLYLSSFASAFDAKHNRASLRGLEGVFVSVERMDSEIEKDGLTRDGIRKDVESKLRIAGIKTISREEWFNVPGSPYLYVDANILKLRTTREYIFSIHIAYKQNVYPVRDPMVILGASTWSTGGIIGITHNLERIRASVRGQVDHFINAYLSINPKK